MSLEDPTIFYNAFRDDIQPVLETFLSSTVSRTVEVSQSTRI